MLRRIRFHENLRVGRSWAVGDGFRGALVILAGSVREDLVELREVPLTFRFFGRLLAGRSLTFQLSLLLAGTSVGGGCGARLLGSVVG